MELSIRHNRAYDDKSDGRMLRHGTMANVKGEHEPICVNCGSNITAESETKSGVIYCCSGCTLTLGLVLFFKRLKQYN